MQRCRPRSWRRTLLILGAFSAGCSAPSDNAGAPTTDDSDSSLIIGDLDWVEVTTLDPHSTERQRSRAVGNVEIPARTARCTGFLVARDVVLTNAHCVPNAEAVEGLTVAFNREHDVPSSRWSIYTCDEFLGNNMALDFALLRCRGMPGDTHGVLTLTDEAVDVDDEIYVVHQNCDFHTTPGCAPNKKLSPGQVSRVGQYIRYNADTALGSSGAPALLKEGDHRVVGVHHAGYGDDGTGRGAYTESIAMTAIHPAIRRQFPDLVLGALVPDRLEPNDVDATPVRGTFRENGLTLHSRDDRDVFLIDLPTGGDIDVAVRFEHDAGDIDLSIGEETAESSTNDEVLQLHGLPAGAYPLHVFGYRGAMNTYDIDIITTPANDTLVYEPNEDGVTAPAVRLPFAFDGRIATRVDVDVYRVDHDGDLRTMRIDFSNDAGDLDLFVYDATGTQIGGSTGTDDAEVVTGAFEAGATYVRIVGYDGARGDYHLTAE